MHKVTIHPTRLHRHTPHNAVHTIHKAFWQMVCGGLWGICVCNSIGCFECSSASDMFVCYGVLSTMGVFVQSFWLYGWLYG